MSSTTPGPVPSYALQHKERKEEYLKMLKDDGDRSAYEDRIIASAETLKSEMAKIRDILLSQAGPREKHSIAKEYYDAMKEYDLISNNEWREKLSSVPGLCEGGTKCESILMQEWLENDVKSSFLSSQLQWRSNKAAEDTETAHNTSDENLEMHTPQHYLVGERGHFIDAVTYLMSASREVKSQLQFTCGSWRDFASKVAAQFNIRIIICEIGQDAILSKITVLPNREFCSTMWIAWWPSPLSEDLFQPMIVLSAAQVELLQAVAKDVPKLVETSSINPPQSAATSALNDGRSCSNWFCQCKGDKPLGSGEGGVVYECMGADNLGEQSYVVKVFSCLEGVPDPYVLERDMHLAIRKQMGSVRTALMNSLCLAEKSCDHHRALLLPKLDTEFELEKYLTEPNNGLLLKDAWNLLNEMGDILDGLHTLPTPIAHGDFKLKNIIVEQGRPILLDFGLSREMTPEDRRESIDLDAKQLLWMALQIRFFLPFKMKDGVGVMIEDPTIDDPLLRWDLHPAVYFLAGSKFDSLMEECSLEKHGHKRRRLCVSDVRVIIEDLFQIQEHNDADKLIIKAPSPSLFKEVAAFAEAMDKGHKNLKPWINRDAVEAQLSCLRTRNGCGGQDWSEILEGLAPICNAFDELRAELGELHEARVRQLHFLLMMSDDIAITQVKECIKEIRDGFSKAGDQVEGMYASMKATVDEIVEANKWAWTRFIPVVGPFIKAVCYAVTGNLKGFFESVWELSFLPAVQNINLAISIVRCVCHFMEGRWKDGLIDVAGFVRDAIVKKGGVLGGFAGGVSACSAFDAAAGGALAGVFGGEFFWMGQLKALRIAFKNNGQLNIYKLAEAAEAVWKDGVKGHNAEEANELKQLRKVRMLRENSNAKTKTTFIYRVCPEEEANRIVQNGRLQIAYSQEKRDSGETWLATTATHATSFLEDKQKQYPHLNYVCVAIEVPRVSVREILSQTIPQHSSSKCEGFPNLRNAERVGEKGAQLKRHNIGIKTVNFENVVEQVFGRDDEPVNINIIRRAESIISVVSTDSDCRIQPPH